MSYNIIGSKLLDGDCYISAKILKKLKEKFDEDLPEENFIDNYLDEQDEGDIVLEDFSWSGVWSGNSFGLLTRTILPKIKGWAKIRYVWEDGEISIITLKDGKVEEEDG